jgi:hypothetical protein
MTKGISEIVWHVDLAGSNVDRDLDVDFIAGYR